MNFANRSTSHVADAPPKRGEIGEAMRKIAQAHARLMPIKRCHPWRSKQFATKPKQNEQ